MSNKVAELLQQTSQEPGPVVKAINYAAAALGVGTFLGLVNLVVGLLSALWLGAQLYGYVRYEIPHKRAKLRAALRDLGEDSKGASL